MKTEGDTECRRERNKEKVQRTERKTRVKEVAESVARKQ